MILFAAPGNKVQQLSSPQGFPLYERLQPCPGLQVFGTSLPAIFPNEGIALSITRKLKLSSTLLFSSTLNFRRIPRLVLIMPLQSIKVASGEFQRFSTSAREGTMAVYVGAYMVSNTLMPTFIPTPRLKYPV